MKNLLFLYNPVAGKRQIMKQIDFIIDFYTKKDFLVTMFPTGWQERITHILAESRDQFDRIVCAGGDGTLNGIVSACMEAHCDIPVGYLPMGSTNDFAVSLGYTTDFQKNLSRSCGNKYQLIDIGKLGNRYFVYVAAFGSFAEVSYTTPQGTKNILGHFAYILNGIQKITELKSYHIKVDIKETSVEGDFFLGLIMNSFCVGGFKSPVCNDVVLDDGLFEVLFVRMPKNLSELNHIIKDLKNMNFNSKMFVYMQTDSLKVESDPLNWTLDGEYGGMTEAVEIQNCRKALKMVC